ncbi:MAG TPA: endonuclease SmrB [Colwellia sp.]|nr:endonuclease SmrB [Colwellia sp.]|tara:strand:- start:639 stop:1346 length:708 start_codon:yes stop_codon:yes gene_type:complete
MFYTALMKNRALKSKLSAIKAKVRANIEASAQSKIQKNKMAESLRKTNESINTVLDTVLPDEKKLFADAIGQVKPLVIDTVRLIKRGCKSNTSLKNDQEYNKANKAIAQFHFSDEFEPNLNKQGPMKYVRQDVDSFEVKNLRRGHYRPDLILDLHGLDQHQAKKELAALLFACQKEHAQCICVVHGIGSHILKNKVPHWLVQHPDVMAFHQAPLEWGGNGAILALIELKDKYNRD